MQDYFLVIDTETSGLPKNWSSPYAKENNWPHVVQIAWAIYNRDFELVKTENHYLQNTGFSIDKTAFSIHGISEAYLQEHGEESREVFNILCADVEKYRPLLVGHLITFDYHMINVELYRLGIANIFKDLQLFCTMKASASYVKNPIHKELKLKQFYKTLFNERLESEHNALSDALNTAKIFFHLVRTNKLTENDIYNQKLDLMQENKSVGLVKSILSLFF
ncbi:3'-5' exonuclease [Pedobacter sp. MW01-1-1]|uniref:3'-5' exonuclease n=1 Tax=Pedobacter sp. MW01-1-1 TaxID=3383027 RepID=UPI003FEF07E6